MSAVAAEGPGGSWGRRRAEECGGRLQVPRPIRNLASIFFPSLLSSLRASLGCTGGRDGLPQHLAPYSLESLRELFAASDPLSREGRRQVWGGRRS